MPPLGHGSESLLALLDGVRSWMQENAVIREGEGVPPFVAEVQAVDGHRNLQARVGELREMELHGVLGEGADLGWVEGVGPAQGGGTGCDTATDGDGVRFSGPGREPGVRPAELPQGPGGPTLLLAVDGEARQRVERNRLASMEKRRQVVARRESQQAAVFDANRATQATGVCPSVADSAGANSSLVCVPQAEVQGTDAVRVPTVGLPSRPALSAQGTIVAGG